MTIRFNKLNSSYNNYNFVIGQKVSEEETKKAQETKEVEKSNVEYKGLKNETDLLTKNTQNYCRVNLGKFTAEDKKIADSTNEILAELGFAYKVSANDVASVTNGLNNVILPGMKSAEDGAVAAHIQDPDGPFADLFA